MNVHYCWASFQERSSKSTESDLQKSENEEHITSTDPSSFRRKKIEKFDKLNYCGQKVSTEIMKYDTCFSQLKSQGDIEVQAFFQAHEDAKNCIIDLECSVETDTR